MGAALRLRIGEWARALLGPAAALVATGSNAGTRALRGEKRPATTGVVRAAGRWARQAVPKLNASGGGRWRTALVRPLSGCGRNPPLSDGTRRFVHTAVNAEWASEELAAVLLVEPELAWIIRCDAAVPPPSMLTVNKPLIPAVVCAVFLAAGVAGAVALYFLPVLSNAWCRSALELLPLHLG